MKRIERKSGGKGRREGKGSREWNEKERKEREYLPNNNPCGFCSIKEATTTDDVTTVDACNLVMTS